MRLIETLNPASLRTPGSSAPWDPPRAAPRDAPFDPTGDLPGERPGDAPGGQPPRLRSARLGVAVRRALGGLLPLVDEPRVRDIMVHAREGVAEIWVDRGNGAEREPGWDAPAALVTELAIALVAAGGRHLDELNPCQDVRLGDGIRVHAVLEPVAVAGSVLSIRLPAPESLPFRALVSAGLCSEEVAGLLTTHVRARRNFLITGGAGSGKTTLLGALLGLTNATERIITIEDVAELRPIHPHHIALETRQANTEGAGSVGLERLLREALRMRPDRLVLGECRGAEVATLFSALNTGHEGGAGTLHANRIADVPARLEALGALAGLSAEALARQAVSALKIVVHLERRDSGHRIAQLGRLRLTDEGTLGVQAYAPEE